MIVTTFVMWWEICCFILLLGTTLSLRFTKHVSDLHHKLEAQHLSKQLEQLYKDRKQQVYSGDML